MTTYNQDREEAPEAERNSTIVEFYDRCRKSADKSTPWHMLHPQHQAMFTQTVDIIHSIIYQDAYAEGWDKIFGKKDESQKKPSIILSNRIQCNKCNDIIESKNRHDFVLCKCESVGVDGGRDYLRRIGDPDDYTDLSEVTSEEVDNWFERVRETFTWKSYGKSGKEQAKEILLKNLDEDHIRAILETQWHIKGTHAEEFMKKELEYRSTLERS